MTDTINLNNTFLEFTNDLILVYPNYKQIIDKQTEKINKKKETKYYLEYFVRHILSYMEFISTCNYEKCSEINFNILHGLKFNDIWNNNLKMASKHAIWRYLHTLFLQTVNHSKIKLVIKKYNEHDNYNIIKKSYDNHQLYIKNIIDCSTKFADEIIKEQNNNSENNNDNDNGNFFNNINNEDFEDKFLNSNIGNLAKEISEEIDPSQLENLNDPSELFNSLLNGTGDSNNLGNLFKTVGDKLQNKLSKGGIDENQLFNEAQNMMSMINPGLKNMTDMMNMDNLFSNGNNE